MFAPYLTELIDEAEIESLGRAFGPVRRLDVAVDMTPDTFEEWWKAVVRKPNRRGEVVLAVQRPDRQVLLHTKAQYPVGTYRLLSGGVKPGEAVLDALTREAHEETGLGVTIARFAGVISYGFQHVEDGRRMAFVSYVFVVHADDSPPVVQDPDEHITDFRYVAPAELPAIARELRALPPGWSDWGEFRAPAHELVAEVLGV